MKYKHKITGEEVKVYNEHYYIAPDTACIPKRFIENSNDWEKVEELDYEILSVIGKDTRVISKANYTFPECFKTLVNSTDTFEIYSVKNLYDGEVFTIGDKVKSKRLTDDDLSPVTKIYIDNNRDAKPVGGLIIQTGGYYQAKINEITKVKTPLFTTEDGVEIFEGADFFYPNTHVWVVNKTKANKEITHVVIEVNKYKTFSTKEKAEEYVLINKPMLSLQDLLNVWGISMEYETYKTSPLFHSFLELAKSKL